jgi:broad specificity phosphatase PhoE
VPDTRGSGAIILTRHGRPALSRKVLLNADEYRAWWARYEVGGLLAGQCAPPESIEAAKAARVIASSTRRRAIESAGLAAPGRTPVSEAVFIEAPLPPPPFPKWLRLSPRIWGFVTRFLWWFFDVHSDQESRAQAEARAEIAADRLIEMAAAGDVVLFAHGFFNILIARAFKARGWRSAETNGWRYWSTKRLDPPFDLIPPRS